MYRMFEAINFNITFIRIYMKGHTLHMHNVERVVTTCRKKYGVTWRIYILLCYVLLLTERTTSWFIVYTYVVCYLILNLFSLVLINFIFTYILIISHLNKYKFGVRFLSSNGMLLFKIKDRRYGDNRKYSIFRNNFL